MHGYGASSVFWYRNFAALSRSSNRLVLAADLLGFGLSDRAEFPARVRGDDDAWARAAERFFLDEFDSWRETLGLANRPIALLVSLLLFVSL